MKAVGFTEFGGPGMEAAGVVDQTGAGTDTDRSLGDHVMAIVLADGSRGTYAEQVVLPAESVVRTPTVRAMCRRRRCR
ncbi:alcohol dehydrogenase catalytic domain-containing protein [Streptomyces sp. NPDC002623]